MFKRIFAAFILIVVYKGLCAQDIGVSPQGKKDIDTSVLGKWSRVENPLISNNGNYALYTITNQPLGRNTVVIKKINDSWKRELIIDQGWFNGFFSYDSKQFILLSSDTLTFLPLVKGIPKSISNVINIKRPLYDRGKWMAYKLNNAQRELVLLNVYTGKELHYYNIDDFSFDDAGNTLLLNRTTDSVHELQLIRLSNTSMRSIWSSKNAVVTNFVFDTTGTQIAFTVRDKINNEVVTNTIWYYKFGMGSAEVKISNQTSGIEHGMSIVGSPQFSKNGRWLFFHLQNSPKKISPKVGAPMVSIWSYKDLNIQPEQLRQSDEGERSYWSAMNLNLNQITSIELEDEMMMNYPGQITGDFVVVMDNVSNREYWRRLSKQPSFYLLSLIIGTRTLLKKESRSLYNFSFSPHGKYLVYYDAEKKTYLSFCIATGNICDLTKNINANFSSEYFNSYNHLPVAVCSIAGWEDNDSSVLIYDNYDIWKLDPLGNSTAVNVTNGYGLLNHIKFRLVDGPAGLQDASSMCFNKNDTLLLTAFNTSNKYNGFYRKQLKEGGNLELLTMGPYTFYKVESQKPHFYAFDNGMKPLKSKDANVWIIQRESENQAPNFFLTNDFKSFKALSNLQPQLNYNWLTSELITWKQSDGTFAQGILYKPENFDSHKKYPVIFNLYRQLSHRLYEFPYPEFSNDNINIPWFVSNGYLVFTPDVNYNYKESRINASSNCIISAAQYLSNLSYIDSQKIGIQGHSWGAEQINYILTKTSLFAAAAEFAGVTDNISSYLTLVPFKSSIEHLSRYPQTELAYGGNYTLWQQKEQYINASSVINADRIVTPLLIIHNEKDNQIAWRQGVELYMALRRLERKVWMLQYDNGGHGVTGIDAVDYTIRLTQFFNYYLKDQPAPVWMTRGVAAKDKGLKTGYEFDTETKTP